MFFLRFRDSRAEMRFCSRRSRRRSFGDEGWSRSEPASPSPSSGGGGASCGGGGGPASASPDMLSLPLSPGMIYLWGLSTPVTS